MSLSRNDLVPPSRQENAGDPALETGPGDFAVTGAFLGWDGTDPAAPEPDALGAAAFDSVVAGPDASSGASGSDASGAAVAEPVATGPDMSGSSESCPPAWTPAVSGGRESGQTPDSEPGQDAAEDSGEDALPPVPSDAEIARLRELLFSREIALLDKLRGDLTSARTGARRVSNVLAEAVVLRSAKDNNLNVALEPVVDEILKVSLRKRHSDLVAALFPLMGPTIRKSIAEAFRSMLDSFSKTLEMAFSWKGLRWRLEALRTGRSFSEIVMLNTLAYRVEQIFFIHSETGLVLNHLTHEGSGAQDADMVSAMLTAIQDFVRDCFTGGGEGDLESLRMGEFTILIEKSPQAYLACVVRGTPPADFQGKLRTALELMLVEYADDLASFNGDAAPFTSSVRYLDPLLVTHYVDEGRPLPLGARLLPVAALLLLVGLCGYYYQRTEHAAALRLAERQQQEERTRAFFGGMREAVNLLRAESGLVVVSAEERSEAPWTLYLLKDALARNPTEVLAQHGVDAGLFVFKETPFISLDSTIVTRRVDDAVALPESVSMELRDDGTLYFKGSAPLDWISRAREEARSLPGVKQVDISGLHDPRMEEIAALKKRVEDTIIEFPLGKDAPVPADAAKLAEAMDALVDLEKLVGEMGFSLNLTIYGHADATGHAKRNYEISEARARTVAALLYARGSSIPISLYGMGSQYPKGGASESEVERAAREDQASRRIELRVHLLRSAGADSDIF